MVLPVKDPPFPEIPKAQTKKGKVRFLNLSSFSKRTSLSPHLMDIRPENIEHPAKAVRDCSSGAGNPTTSLQIKVQKV